MNHTKGSTWRKWDLHIHTPLSIIQEYGGPPQWDRFIESLRNLPSDVKVIGINDYYFIDGYEKVMEAKIAGKLPNLEKIFPVLEFRVDTFGNGGNALQKLNLHILFDVDEANLKSEIKLIREEFILQIPISTIASQSTKKLTPENLTEAGGGSLKEGLAHVIPPTQAVFEVINSATWKHKTFTFLGYTEWNTIEKGNQLKPLKEGLHNKVCAFFTSNFNTHAAHQAWLKGFGNKPLLHSMDVHSFDMLDTTTKDSDGNYLPPINYSCNTWIKADPTFEGIKQIKHEPELRCLVREGSPETKAGYQVISHVLINNNKIKNTNIQFNPNLNSIIGGRSAGKSVLLTAIAQKLKSDNQYFRKSDKYQTFIQNISQTINVIWQDGEEDDSREIEFFQQGYMYEIALSENNRNQLVHGVLKQKGKDVLIGAFESFKTEHKKKISSLVSNTFQVFQAVRNKQQEATEMGDKKGIEEEIEKLETELNNSRKTTITEDEYTSYQSTNNEISLTKKLLTENRSDYAELGNLSLISLFKDDIAFETTSLTPSIRDEFITLFNSLKERAEKDWEAYLEYQRTVLNSTQDTLNVKIAALSAEPTFVQVAAYIQTNSYLTELEQKIQIQKIKIFNVNALLEEIHNLNNQFKELYKQLSEAPVEYYNKINELLPLLQDDKDGLRIGAKLVFDNNSFNEKMGAALNKQSGLTQDFIEFNYDNIETYKAHLNSILINLFKGVFSFKTGNSRETLCTSIMSECFFSLTYELEYENDNFDEMSDGKKAFVVLKLLLDFSNKNCPILIDQPEDDLDNRAIYLDLVQYLKKKKQLRQIILATHNPNIVVGADSELVIVANQHGIKNENQDKIKFEYTSGSLECSFAKIENQFVLQSQGVREHVCEILEGGDVAFKHREQKYSFAN